MGESVVGKLPPNASRILSGDKAQPAARSLINRLVARYAR